MDIMNQMLNLAADSMDDMFLDSDLIDEDEMNDICLDEINRRRTNDICLDEINWRRTKNDI